MPTLPSDEPVDTPESPAASGIGFAGICLQAADTGRVLLLQRSLADTEDPNAGLWEFPGGGLDQGEDPWGGAIREFGEEVGVPVPEEADNSGTAWDLPPEAPKYRLHYLLMPSESLIDLNSNEVQNPDDPRGLDPESLAFWDPTHITGDHIRPEVLEAMPVIKDTLDKVKPASAPAPEAKAALDAEAVAASEASVAAADAPAGPPPPTPAPAEEDTQPDPTTEVIDLLEQIETALADPQHDPAAVAELVVAAKDILNPGEQPTEADMLTASAAPVQPPDEWFEPFELDGPTPLTITADGRVFGHLTTWDSCHRGGQYSNKCQRPPSDPKAPFFQLGQVLTASGSMVDVGVITVGGGHWTKQGLMTTLEHHDDVTAAAATVVVMEDKYGIGLFGSVTPDATPKMVAALRRSPVSGAWRKERGVHRLKGVHAVNDPGYPVPRSLVASADGNDIVVVDRVPSKEPVIDLSAAARRLARSAGLDTESLVASARAAMADLDCGCDDDLVASLSGDTSLPVAEYDREWDGGQAADRVFEWAQGDVDKISKAFLWRNEEFAADIKAGWDLPFADVIDGELKIVPRGVQATAGGHGVGQLDGISDEDKKAIEAKIGEFYRSVLETHGDQAPTNPFEKESA